MVKNLPDEVTHAHLEIYSDAALDGRLIHYQREALLERDPELREACREEVTRTQTEINRRKTAKAAEAARLFAAQ